MAIVTKMCNPTGWDIHLEYEAGKDIVIPANGSKTITMQQTDDFREGKPGSEVTRGMLDWEGAFLLDSDRSYDSQALQALNTALVKRKERIRDFFERTQNSRMAAGNAAVDDATLQEIALRAGYGMQMKQLEQLETRVKMFSEVVSADNPDGRVKQTLDPKRTCFVVQPPKQFESETQLAVFLAENPEIKIEHDQYAQALAE